MRIRILTRAIFLAISLLSVGFARHAIAQAHGTNSSEAELSIKKLEPAAGLKVELFAAEPLLQNPVAFSIDEKGRFFISETHRYKDSIFDITQKPAWLTNDLGTRTVAEREAFLRRTFGTNSAMLTNQSEIIRLIEDRDSDGRAETSHVFANGFNEITSGTAAGILARKGNVWFTCIPDLWKLKEENGRAISREKLSTGYGPRISVSGHDLHGLALGPDGRIYFSCGDRGFSVTNREGNVFAYPETGGVLRCDPDGSNLELYCIGLRNPQELAFDDYGNLFTDDNDTAGPDDSRVIYIVEGADYGWRAPYQYMEGYGPWCRENFWKGDIDDLLPYSGVVAHGPAGLAYYPGTGLPPKYKGHFFACDFPQGVKSFAVKPRGASFEVYDVENFLKRIGATDVAFGPGDGVYVSDWGLAYTMPNAGRIYHVFDPSHQEKTSTAVAKLLSDIGSKSSEELKALLAHEDMRVRLEAQFTIINKGLTSVRILQQVVHEQTNRLARVQAIFGLSQLNHRFRANVVSADQISPVDILEELLSDKDAEIRAQAAKALGEGSIVKTDALTKALADENPRVRFFAAMSLGKLKNSESIDAMAEMLRKNNDADPFLVHAVVYALVKIGDEQEIDRLSADPSPAVRHATLLCMRRMNNPKIEKFLNDAEPKLVLEAARAVNDGPVNEALPELAAMLNETTRFTSNYFSKLPATIINPREQFLRRAVNANFRVGEPQNADALAKFAGNDHAPESLREEALKALTDWEHPDSRDRVVGMWRPLRSRSKDDAEISVRNAISDLLHSNSEAVLQSTIHLLRVFGLSDTTILIVDFFTDPNRPASVRIESLGALVDLKHEGIEEVIKQGLGDSNVELRREAIRYIEHVNPVDTVKILEKLFTEEKDIRIGQTILMTLGNVRDVSADAALARLLDELMAGKIRDELHLDLLEAAGKRSSEEIKQRLNAYRSKFSKDDLLATYRPALIGGDAELGKKIFQEREDVGCLRCHSVRKIGGTVGPDLGGIGKRQTREYLLESIVFPNSQIAPGFENAVVLLKNGNSYAGLVKSETDSDLVIESPEDGQVNVKKSDLVKRNRGLSPMPEEISKLLTSREIRDVIEYLSTLK